MYAPRKTMRCLQIFPRLHGEKFISPASAMGLMRNFALASQVSVSNGQQAVVELQPSAHYSSQIEKIVENDERDLHRAKKEGHCTILRTENR